MKKLALLVVLVVAFALMGGVALAAETPHGPFDTNSAVCAACHRAHTSSAEYLLATPRVTGLCIGCHDGSGADTDVMNGLFVVNGTQFDKTQPNPPGTPLDNGYNHATWGSAAFPLMGGGFLNVNDSTGATATTSKHMNPTNGLATTTFIYQWGKKTVGSQVGPSGGYTKTFLDCVDCHMPHRSSNYRMLRMKPTGYTATDLLVPSNGIVSAGVIDPLNATEIASYAGTKGRRYTEDSGMWNTVYGHVSDSAASISKWCGKGCHDFYYDAALKGPAASGKSPAMSTRLTVSYTAPAYHGPGATDNPYINLMSVSGITVGTQLYINGVQYGVLGVGAGAPLNHVGADPNDVFIDHALHAGGADPTLYAGTPVSISGAGMGVYYEVDPGTGTTAQPNFTHAIDVDLKYTPRNSAGLLADEQNLAPNLAAGAYANKLPVSSSNYAYNDVDVMTCVTCHRAHGTDVPMGAEAALADRHLSGVDAPDAATAATNGSMLLRLENRAVCQQCHQMPTGF